MLAEVQAAGGEAARRRGTGVRRSAAGRWGPRRCGAWQHVRKPGPEGRARWGQRAVKERIRAAAVAGTKVEAGLLKSYSQAGHASAVAAGLVALAGPSRRRAPCFGAGAGSSIRILSCARRSGSAVEWTLSAPGRMAVRSIVSCSPGRRAMGWRAGGSSRSGLGPDGCGFGASGHCCRGPLAQLMPMQPWRHHQRTTPHHSAGRAPRGTPIGTLCRLASGPCDVSPQPGGAILCTGALPRNLSGRPPVSLPLPLLR